MVCDMIRVRSVLSVVLIVVGWSVCADDWFRWRGPNLDGISAEKQWLAKWPKEGPRQVWKAKVGVGFSSCSVAKGRLYTMGNRSDQDTIYCFDAETGKEVWKHSYPCDLDPRYYEGGTSCTPTVDGDRVYTLSRKGHVFCLEAATGKVLWQKNIAEELKLEIPEWGFASSPLVEGDLILLNAGAAGTALNKTSGQVVWSSGKGGAGYSSAVPFSMGDKRFAALFAARAVIAVNAKTGEELWRHPWKTSYDVNAADPIIMGDKIFISSGYNHGCALLQFTGSKVSVVWENKSLRTQFNPAVIVGGFIFGADGDAGGAQLRCIDLQTGEVKWTQRSPAVSSLMAADGKLIVQGDRGELIIAEAAGDSFKPLSRAQVLGGKCWTTPVLANSRIYCRNAQGDIVCLDVKS
jgi:outer membrane protein assembly factor BamB